MFRRILNKELTDTHMEQLFSSGTTRLIKGFKGKKGVPFDAAVTFDAEYNSARSGPPGFGENHPRAAPVFSSENLACGGGTHPGP